MSRGHIEQQTGEISYTVIGIGRLLFIYNLLASWPTGTNFPMMIFVTDLTSSIDTVSQIIKHLHCFISKVLNGHIYVALALHRIRIAFHRALIPYECLTVAPL